MDDNYGALFVSIIKGCTPEVAIRLMGINYMDKASKKAVDLDEIIKLKAEGKTYAQIGKLFNISGDAVFMRIKRAKRAV
jgi:hypothetical protein